MLYGPGLGQGHRHLLSYKTNKNRVIMQSNKDNGNTQINSTKDSYNNRVSNFRILGGSRRITWNDKRRHSSI